MTIAILKMGGQMTLLLSTIGSEHKKKGDTEVLQGPASCPGRKSERLHDSYDVTGRVWLSGVTLTITHQNLPDIICQGKGHWQERSGIYDIRWGHLGR